MRGSTVARNPNKSNIRYVVLPKPANQIMVLRPFLDSLISGKVIEKCLCFCRKYDDTNDLYETAAIDSIVPGVDTKRARIRMLYGGL